MDVTGAIKARRSIRKFKRKEMPPEQMDHILEMARTAPSGANRQPWQMVVITDRQRLKDLVPICKDQAFVGDCSAFLIGVDDPQQKWAKVDLAIAMDHISLAARGRGPWHRLGGGLRPGPEGGVHRGAGRPLCDGMHGAGISRRDASTPGPQEGRGSVLLGPIR